MKMKKERKSQGEGGCVQRMEVIVKRKKSREGGGGGGQGRCEPRSEAFVKILFFSSFFLFFGGGGRGGGARVGGWGLGQGWGRVAGGRVDGNREVKLV